MRNTLEGKLGAAGGGTAGQELKLKKVLKKTSELGCFFNREQHSFRMEGYLYTSRTALFGYFCLFLRFQSQICYVGGLYRVGYM